ncbi:MAG: HAD-IA family hydrolase [Candidatus Nanoarchaeia archaeon]|nr:HAD-IA family hydrolase [Candidatus Nanoarchaeia archaeon]
MLIILDLDGTLINSETAHFNSFVKAINRKGHKLSFLQKKEIKSRFGMSGTEIIKGVLPKISFEEVKQISNDVKSISISEEFDKVKFINGAKKFLKDNFKKHDLALATNSSKLFTYKTIEELKIINFFKKVITASDVKNAKPDPEMINKIIKELNYEKKNCVMIGDSIYDYLSAKKANVRFIAVLSKSDYANELKKVAECFNDLSEVKI